MAVELKSGILAELANHDQRSAKNMSQFDQPSALKPIHTERENLLHDLRDRLNTIQSSAMVLDRKGSVNPEDEKFLNWILEKANEADELVNLIAKGVDH